MTRNEFTPFEKLNIPIVLLDSYFPNLQVDCVTINNVDSAETATDYLIKSIINNLVIYIQLMKLLILMNDL